MQELVGRLTTLDPEASESLKVIAYFDALVAGDVGVEALARAAALLTGAIAGFESPSQAVRVSPEGTRIAEPGGVDAWPSMPVAPEEAVWIERAGVAHANDAMVLERFALAVAVLRARRRSVGDDPLQRLIDGTQPVQERAIAAARLRLDGARARMLATLPAAPVQGVSTLVPTEHGVFRATVLVASEQSSMIESEGHAEPSIAQGVGTWGDPEHLAVSWAEALFALRLTDAAHPRVDASELGVLLPAVRAAEQAGVAHSDVTALARLDVRAARMLAVLVDAESVRGAASTLGLHHSTVQTRHDGFTHELGYDPRSARGRARYAIAALLLRLREE